MKGLITILSALLFIASLQAGIIRIPADQPNIQAGIDAALEGDTVLVDEGLWYDQIFFRGKAVTVASHFIMDGDTNHIGNTIIDGSLNTDPDSGSVVYFIASEDTNSVLCGFTITGGSGTITEYSWHGGVFPGRTGGGVFTYNSGARISNNIIRNNNIPIYTNTYGGGINVYTGNSGAHARIDGNKIITNIINGQGQSQGSGIFFHGDGTIANNDISLNTTYANNEAFGAVGFWADSTLRHVLVKDNHITGNVVNGDYATAGGIQIEVGIKAVIIGNTISDNILNGIAFGEGGGIRLVWMTDMDTIDSNIITGNKVYGSSSYAGGIMIRDSENTSNTLITNNIISGNSAKDGGGIRCLGSKAQMINNTIVNNIAGVGGGGLLVNGPLSEAIVINTILWGNSALSGSQISITGGLAPVASSDVEGGWPGDGNINADPFFADSLFNLADSSLCIGRGIDSLQIDNVWYYAPDHDFDGDPRPNPPGSMPDIGAQESPLGTPVAIEPISGLLPKTSALHQNYPNPFNPSTTIEFALANGGWVTLKIYNVLGEEVAELVAENLSAGSYKYDWNAAGLASGMYFYRLEAGRYKQTRKLVLLK